MCTKFKLIQILNLNHFQEATAIKWQLFVKLLENILVSHWIHKFKIWLTLLDIYFNQN